MTTKILLPALVCGAAIWISGCGPATPTPWPFAPLAITLELPFSQNAFYENFDDNDLNSPWPPWVAGTHAMGYHDEVCQPDTGCFLRFEGPSHNMNQYHDTGLAHYLGEAYEGIQPDYVSFYFFAYAFPGAVQGYFVLEGRLHPDQAGSYLTGIDFHIQDQQIFINWNTFSQPLAWDDHWYHVEFKNIDWSDDPPKFDLYLDGSLAGGCISFINSIQSFQLLSLYNMDPGYVGFDTIYMGIGSGDNAFQAPACAVPPPPLPTATPQPGATPTPTPTATPSPVPFTCEGLGYDQCIGLPGCQWVESDTRSGTGHCADKE